VPSTARAGWRQARPERTRFAARSMSHRVAGLTA
jgi:hypothetical protein